MLLVLFAGGETEAQWDDIIHQKGQQQNWK